MRPARTLRLHACAAATAAAATGKRHPDARTSAAGNTASSSPSPELDATAQESESDLRTRRAQQQGHTKRGVNTGKGHVTLSLTRHLPCARPHADASHLPHRQPPPAMAHRRARCWGLGREHRRAGVVGLRFMCSRRARPVHASVLTFHAALFL